MAAVTVPIEELKEQIRKMMEADSIQFYLRRQFRLDHTDEAPELVFHSLLDSIDSRTTEVMEWLHKLLESNSEGKDSVN